MSVYIYSCPPMDLYWKNCPDYLDFLKTLGNYDYKNYLNLMVVAIKNAICFEGDFAVKPVLMTIPTHDCEPQVVIAWKQGNNGTTFYASYEPILSLYEIDRDMVAVI